MAGFVLVAGAGSSMSANGPLPPWLDNGRGPWIARVCALPIPAVAGCSAAVVTDSAGRPQASSSPPAGALGPSQFHSAYNLPASAPGTQTIAIVDAYDDPNIASDLAKFDSQYGLPAPPSFQKVNQNGGTSYPSTNSGWALEISLDVEVAHAICQNCNILLVEASSNSLANLGAAENEAVKLGATVISNSWGASEYSSETSDESSYFKHPGVVITASAGDSGYGVEFPAASQYVTAVGGTTLNLSNGSYGSESVWNGTGSGCSAYVTKPSWQHDAGCSRRTVNDVSADADPNTGAAVYDSVAYSGQTGWFQVGGTSLSAPLIAAVYALAGTPTSVTYGSAAYAAGAGQLHDVTSGSNGSCGSSYLCTAKSGYDAPTGLGTPNGVGAFAAASSTTPGAPTGLQASAGNGSVTLSWTAPTNTGSSGISGYNIYRGTTSGGETFLASVAGTTTTYPDTGLTNGTTYYYEVSAVSGSIEGAKSGEASATPATKPGQPTGLTPTAGNGSVSLAWTAPGSNGGAPITGYKIYRGTAPGGESPTAVTTVSGTSYTDGGLTNGTTYYYTVAAVNSAGTGVPSTEASATPTATVPGAPTSLTASAGNGSVSLSWSAPSNNGGSNINGYNVYRGTASGAETLLTSVSGTSYSDTAVTNGTKYYYVVTAVNVSGQGANSNEASATPLAGDFSIAISPSTRYLGSSATTTYTVTITPSNGFSGQVSLSVSGLPAHVTGTFSPNPASSSSTLTITSSGAGFANVKITVTATSGSLTHSATATLFVF